MKRRSFGSHFVLAVLITFVTACGNLVLPEPSDGTGDTSSSSSSGSSSSSSSSGGTGTDTIDTDADGAPDSTDNCPAVANADQVDTDLDNFGDGCDVDDDDDDVADAEDAFPTDPEETVDSDADGTGDNGDNCLTVTNAGQTDTDDDGLGDACDGDDDADGYTDGDDAFPVNSAEWLDTDSDGLGNNADLDDDNDNATDEFEEAKGTDPLQPDMDGDGILDGNDNCPWNVNPAQTDFDGDGTGDVCDPDDDSDGFDDAVDLYPVDPTRSADWLTVSPGGWHTCALLKTGNVRCWGAADRGQLGDGGSGTQTCAKENLYYGCTKTPVDVVGLGPGVREISAGGWHTCALIETGEMKCWGNNGMGQVGNGGSGSNLATPVTVAGLESGVEEIDAGMMHTCAVTDTGGALCWGYDIHGQIGNGYTTTGIVTPTAVVGLSSETSTVGAGFYKSCALLDAGSVKCWGDGATIPNDVPGLDEGVVALTVGGNHACALMTTSGVKCWGKNASGQLGNGTDENSGAQYVVGLDSGVRGIAAGSTHSCALLDSGRVKCWGSSGQLGNGSSFGSECSYPCQTTPVDVLQLEDVQMIAAGEDHTCALTNTGGLKCWGANDFGQLGTRESVYNDTRLVPVTVVP